MIIKYKFSTGEVTEVEVSEEIGTVILDSRREEHASNERHRYHTAFSLDDMDYEDKDLISPFSHTKPRAAARIQDPQRF